MFNDTFSFSFFVLGTIIGLFFKRNSQKELSPWVHPYYRTAVNLSQYVVPVVKLIFSAHLFVKIDFVFLRPIISFAYSFQYSRLISKRTCQYKLRSNFSCIIWLFSLPERTPIHHWRSMRFFSKLQLVGYLNDSTRHLNL